MVDIYIFILLFIIFRFVFVRSFFAKMEYDELYEDDLDILDIIQDGFPRNNWERPNYFEDIDELSKFF